MIFSASEGIQMILNFKGYMADFWNMYDVIRIALTITYIVMQN